MAQRYFVDTPIGSATCRLTGQEAQHVSRVMRAKVGDRLTLFDGSGAEFDAEIAAVGRNEVEATILQRREVDRELPRPVVLAVPLPKGDRQRWLVEKVVELGVASLVPVITARSVAQPLAKAVDRLRRTVIEASKQCGRNRLMRIDPARGWAEVVRETPTSASRWIAHPAVPSPGATGPETTRDAFEEMVAEGPDPVLLAVGPEGGFTDEEVALAVAHDWRPVDLGPRILRIETAAVALAALAAQRLASHG